MLFRSYALLQDAQVRNIKEYNVKFIYRKLNPNEGHKYLPYIVLVVDEFAVGSFDRRTIGSDDSSNDKFRLLGSLGGGSFFPSAAEQRGREKKCGRGKCG